MPRKPKKMPTGVRFRKGRYRIIYRGPDGSQVEESVGTVLEDAVAARKRRMREVRDGTWQPKGERRALTIRAYAATWLPERCKTIRSRVAEERWLRRYILPELGDVALEDLRPKDVARWVDGLRDRLSARSIRNAHGVLSAMLTMAVFEEHIPGNPAKGLPRGILPRKGRSTRPATTRAQTLTLLTHRSIDPSRRILYALAGLAGLRKGEAAGRRWRDIEERHGLRALRVESQYHDQPLKGAQDEDVAERIVPIHPELDAMLERWRVEWAQAYGRVPRPDDWLAPYSFKRLDEPRTDNAIGKALMRDLRRVGIDLGKGGGMHSLRRFFTTAALDGGADKDTLREITHRPKGDVLEDSYTRRAWDTLSRAVLCLALDRDEGAAVVALERKEG